MWSQGELFLEDSWQRTKVQSCPQTPRISVRLEREQCAGSVGRSALPEWNWNHPSTSCRHHPLEGCSYKSSPPQPPPSPPSPSLPKLEELNKNRRNSSLESFPELEGGGKQKHSKDADAPSGHHCSSSCGLDLCGLFDPGHPEWYKVHGCWGGLHGAHNDRTAPIRLPFTWAAPPTSQPRNSRLIVENLTSI